MRHKGITAALSLSMLATPALAEVKIGYLAAMTGAQAEMTGASALTATKMAIEDFGGNVNGEPISIISADHLGKPDSGLATAREWLDQQKVNMLMEVDNSAVALAVSNLIKDRDVAMFMGSSSSKLLNENCGPHQVMMLLDTSALARAITIPQVKAGNDKWFFITVDYALGHDLQAKGEAAVKAAGGTVVGSAIHSPQSTDFSAFLLEAQAKGANTIGLATFGSWQNAIVKQAQEFGIKAVLAPYYVADTDIKGAGLDNMQNVSGAIQFYWDQNDKTRAFSKRFRDAFGRPPTFTNAYSYEFTRLYLRAIKETKTSNADKVMEWMRSNSMELINGDTATIRKDGYTVRDVYSFRTKSPKESKGDWDYLTITGKVASDQIAPPLAQSTCPLLK